MKKIYIPKKESKAVTLPMIGLALGAFLFGCILSASLVLNVRVASMDREQHSFHPPSLQMTLSAAGVTTLNSSVERKVEVQRIGTATLSSSHMLPGLSILVAIASFDFSQIPHLEEVVDGYHDLAVAGAFVDVVIHATVPYPVTLIDLWNTRFDSEQFTLTVVLKPKVLRLHLVDCHRYLFYERLNQYDLFIYTEDDIRIRPSTVATYLSETQRIQQLLANRSDFRPVQFNVGIVRYEYNYPANVVMDDNTRHATQNVTRVYWEHSGFERPVVPNAVQEVPYPSLTDRYLSMSNHHQGMFLATRDLLIAWKANPKCRFDEVRDRPGKGSQPTEGTQRVWMSSQMLYGGRHCNVQQVIPKDKFGALTVLHLPNKNYRRVGKYRNRKFADGSEVFETPHVSLLTAMELHLATRSTWRGTPQQPYRGIQMIDEVDHGKTALLERRMKEYHEYVQRGGLLSDYDMTKTELVEES